MTVFETLEELSNAAADEFVRLASDAIDARGRFTVALSGGSTPKGMFALLALSPRRDLVDWPNVFALFGDERYVPPDDPQSNEKMARDTLLSKVSVPEDHIYAMYRPGGPALAAAEYENRIVELLDDDLSIDLMLLGIGPDGHTASLFPGDPAVHEEDRLVVASIASANARDRITMTPPLLNKARCVLFLIAGPDKEAPLKRLIDGELDLDETPSQAIGRFAPNVVYFVDRAAWPG